MNCRVAAREGGLGHAPGFYAFAKQTLFYARCRAAAERYRVVVSLINRKPPFGAVEPVEKLRFSDNLCFDFAKHGRPKVPMRKLSPSISIKTVIHAPGFYDFAQQNLFHARSRAKHCTIEKMTLSTD